MTEAERVETERVEAEAYLERMGIEPTVYGVMDWIEKGQDRKYVRRVLEAFVVARGGAV